MTTINVEIEEQKGVMAISMEIGRSDNSSQSELMVATFMRSKMEEALNIIMSKHSNDEDKEGEEHSDFPDWVMEELEKIENALYKEGKE